MTAATRSTRGPAPTQPIPITAGENIAAFTAYTEIPEDAGARPPISIGNQLAGEMPGFDILPCGYCGTAYDGAPAELLGRTHVLGILNFLAEQAGWQKDVDHTPTCPQCQQDEAWKARQGQLEMRLDGPPAGIATAPPAETCERHAGMNGGRRAHRHCTCPGAVLAVDVMLASKDYEDIDAQFVGALRRNRLRFDRLSKVATPEHGYQPGRHRSPAPQQRGAA